MFIAQWFLQAQRDRINDWEEACNKWLEDGKEYSYRTRSDFRMYHPQPFGWVKPVLQYGTTFAVIVFISLFVTWLCIVNDNDTKAHDKAKTQAITQQDKK